jgi:hypothetical protein
LVTVTTPASGTISQYLATAKIDSNNNITVYGGVPLGTTGPNTFAYGEGGASAGGANGNGGQGQLAAVNSTMVGGWYTWKAGERPGDHARSAGSMDAVTDQICERRFRWRVGRHSQGNGEFGRGLVCNL